DGRAAAGATAREVRTGLAVLEAERRVLVPDVPAASVEEGLRQLPQLGAQRVELVARDVEQLAVEHLRRGVLLGEPRLELVVGLGEAPLRARLARLRLGDELRAARLELLLGLACALLQPSLDQDVVEDTSDADAERLLDVVGVDGDLEVGPKPLQV